MSNEIYLLNQLKNRPSMKAQDMIKMAYQATFGAEHLLTDIHRAKKYFFEEYENNSSTEEEVTERISEKYCRVNLHAIRIKGIDPNVVFEAFLKTAKESCGCREEFCRLVEEYEMILQSHDEQKRADDLREFFASYLKDEVRSIHHSDSYRENERPAYRVVALKYLKEEI